MTATTSEAASASVPDAPLGSGVLGLGDAVAALRSRWRLLTASLVAGAVAGIAAGLIIEPTFTASTTLLPPQQQQSSAASALASLGSLASLAGGGGALRTPGDQYVALLQSVTIADRLIERFKLQQVYGKSLKVDARLELAKSVRVSLGKKDGLINIEVDDHEPKRAAEMANAYVDELRHLTSGLAVTEAQQRRVFFERHLQQTRDRMTAAQHALLASGYNENVLRAEPKATAESYAKLRAEVTAQEARLQALSSNLTANAPEVRNQQTLLDSLKRQLNGAERESEPKRGDPDYVSRYREFKYQEALFELYARQFELARADESRDGTLIQVIDPATPPEKKSKPMRATLVLGSMLALLALASLWTLVAAARRQPKAGRH